MVREALCGNTRHLIEVFNQLDGKVPDKLVIIDEDGLHPEVAAAMLEAGMEAAERLV